MSARDVAPEDPAVELNRIAASCCKNPTTLKDWQIKAFKRIREKRITVVSVPTGSGKSMIFSLLSQWLGKCVFVIIPLLALMSDQLEKITKFFHLTAAHLGEGVNSYDVFERVKRGEVDILFATPETYTAHPEWAADRSLFNKYFCAFCIDEAQDVVITDYEFRKNFISMCKSQFRKLLVLSGSLTKLMDKEMINSVFNHMPNIKEAFENKISISQDRDNLYLAICGRNNKTDFTPLKWIITVRK